MSQSENTTKTAGKQHLTEAERKTVERMLRAGANKAQIARALCRDKSTIKREIRRGSVTQRKRNRYESKRPETPEFVESTAYFAETGQRVYEKNRRRCGAGNKVAFCGEMIRFVEEKILGPQKWSPDAATGYAKASGLFPGREFSTKTFYNWIDDGLVKVKNIDLLLKVRRKAKRPRKERKKRLGRSIEERPAEVETRTTFGHREGDGVVGKDRKEQIITLVERKIGIGMMFLAADRKSERITEITDDLERRYGKHFGTIFKSVTFDNGSEFADSEGIEKNGRTEAYYAHPSGGFERGTNENWNGPVRRFLPKGKSFAALTDDDMLRIAHYINTLPRKRFGYRTPLDLWNEEMNAILA